MARVVQTVLACFHPGNFFISLYSKLKPVFTQRVTSLGFVFFSRVIYFLLHALLQTTE